METRLGSDFTIIKVVKESNIRQITDHTETNDSESLESRLGKEITVIKVAQDTFGSPIDGIKDTACGVGDKLEHNNVEDQEVSHYSPKDDDDKSEEKREFSIFDIGDMEKRDFGGVTISKQREPAPNADSKTTPN